MSAFSDYAEGIVLQFWFRTGTPTKPSVLAVALGTAASDGSFTELANTGSYARVSLNPADANWAAASGGNGTTSNLAAITFAAASADWNSGSNITHAAIFDSATYGAGNQIIQGSLTTPKTILNSDQASFPIGTISFQVDN